MHRVMSSVMGACTCPAHSQAFGAARRVANAGAAVADYAFEMATSSVRVGSGVTAVCMRVLGRGICMCMHVCTINNIFC